MIIALAGKKQAGKSTLANFLTGHILKCNDIIDKFNVNEKGELVVNCTFVDDGQIKHDMGVMDLNQQTPDFFDFATGRIWPFVKLYAFAEPLKNFLVTTLGVDAEFVFGTNEQKNSLTHLKWQDMPTFVEGKTGFMTGRDIMQYFGTEICRKMDPDIWANATLRRISVERPTLGIITDCRFPNEADAVRRTGGKVVYLTRDLYQDSHASETALDPKDEYDLVIDNQELSIEDSCSQFLDWCVKQGITHYLHRPVVTTAKR